MKYCVVIIDGAAGWPLAAHGGKTCLELARTPNIDSMAEAGIAGLVRTVPPGMEPSSACACMSVLGYDPKTYYRGRSAIEAHGMGIPINEGEAVFRCNLVAVRDGRMWSYSCGHISTGEGRELIATLNERLGNDNVRRAEETIIASLREKEVLLKEIHHCVKNNLQIICSLLNLQAGEIADPKASQTFKESQDRVKAMALIHERLYQSRDLAGIDFAGYVRSLTGHLLRSYRISSSAVQMNLEVDSVPMSLDVAIPCGLIINELVSNAMKYAFPDGRTGAINVRFSENGDQSLGLTVSDDGIGFPAGVNPESSESLGLRLVRSLAEQLGGSLAYSNQSGFRCDIRIPRVKDENMPHNPAG